jgi:cyanophycin synthetase
MEQTREHHDLDSSTRLIKEAAERRGIAFKELIYYNDEVMHEIYELTYQEHVHRMDITSPDLTSSIANSIADNKYLTHRLLDSLKAPALPYALFSKLDEALEYFDKQTEPQVTKPVFGGGGDGVCVNIRERDEFAECFSYTRSFCDHVLIEQFCTGKDTRFLVIGGKVSAIAQREPAFIIGDGVHSIESLIEKINNERAEGRKGPLSKIKMDKISEDYLRKENILLSAVPAMGEKIYVRPNANLNTGGASSNVSLSDIHPDNLALVEFVAGKIGLHVAGIDVLCNDPSRPFQESGGVILEINDRPRIRMHEIPYQGEPVAVSERIIDMLFPETT